MVVQYCATSDWSRSSETAHFGGYVAWEAAHLARPPSGADWYVPVFVQLQSTDSGPQDLRGAMVAVLAMDHLLLAQDERDLLATEISRSPTDWPYPIRFVAFVKSDDLSGLPPFLMIRHVGAPVLLGHSVLAGRPSAQATALTRDDAARVSEPQPKVTVAVMDDGIAYLNARFRSGPTTTRIQRVWLQAAEIMEPAGVICGRTLTGHDIDDLLAGGEPEAEIYRAYNRTLNADHERQSTNHRASHGAHVMDIATGASPGDDQMRAMPILAVQLPPVALRDTSGRRLEGYVVQGLRWLMAQTLRQSAGGPVSPLVVNLSLGSLAGPGNDTDFLAEWFQYEMDRYARLAPRATLRIVAAYGNARRARLMARTELRGQRELSLDWCVLPDDHTPSFVEMRVDRQIALAMRLRIVSPCPTIPPLEIGWPAPGESWTFGQPVIAMVTGVAETGQHVVHVAIAPTAGVDAPSPAGRWKLVLQSTDDAPAPVSIRVQRDDTPAGYRILGRQSWLDHEHGWEWDEVTRDWTAPRVGNASSGCPITREGTPVAYAGTSAPRVMLVGAVRPVTGQPGIMTPALYSASGMTAVSPTRESAGPTLTAAGDDGAILQGRRASGVLSGSTVRLSGTSAAAPAVSRALAVYLDKNPGESDPALELAHLLGSVPAPQRSPLMGFGPLNPRPDQDLIA
jgi:Subtilase family